MASRAECRCVVAVTGPIFLPIKGVLMASLADSLSGMGEVCDVTANFPAGKNGCWVEKLDIVGGAAIC